MRRSMFGIRYFALSGLMILWLCHLIGLHPVLYPFGAAKTSNMNEAQTRAELIDPKLRACGWGVVEGSIFL